MVPSRRRVCVVTKVIFLAEAYFAGHRLRWLFIIQSETTMREIDVALIGPDVKVYNMVL